MDESSRNRLTEQARAIEKFRNLAPNEQEWLLPLLSRGIRTTLELLDCISARHKTFEEIAADMGINIQTVSQKLNALKLGGIDLDLSETAAFAPTGRPRKLARR